MKDRQFELFDSRNDCIWIDEKNKMPLSSFVHTRENNIESEAILRQNLPHISKQCQRTLDLLKSGIRLTVRSAMIDFGISSLSRRILDLKQAGFEIRDELIDGRFKVYFM